MADKRNTSSAAATEESDDGSGDWETDDETDMVVQLAGVQRDEFIKVLMNNPGKCTSLGLDSEEPHIQVGNDVFQGSYANSVGTNLFFEVTDYPDNEDVPYTVKLLTQSHKVLDMKKLYIQRKTSEGVTDTKNEEASMSSYIKDNRSSIELAADDSPAEQHQSDTTKDCQADAGHKSKGS